MLMAFPEKLIKKLINNGFEVLVAPNVQEAGIIVRSKIEEINPDSVS